MAEYEEYRFKIDAYSPESIPMTRLALYMLEFGKLLANDDRVHFKEIEPGSTVLLANVEYEAAPKVSNRIESLSRGDAPDDARAIFTLINEMLRDDNAVGQLTKRAANEDKINEAEILKFLGREIPVPKKMGPFTESAIVDGELMRIGGRDESAHAQILDAEGRVWNGELTRELAQEIAPHLYKGAILRVEGDARWVRTEDGAWELKGFHIRGFTILPKDTLIQAVERIRKIEGSEWRNMDDPDGFVREQRRDDDEIH